MHLSFRKQSNQVSQSSSPSAAGDEDLNVKKLQAEFDRLLKIKDRLKRDYMLIRQAKASDIETSLYKEMFASYRERQVRLVGKIMPELKSVIAILTHLAIFSGLILFVMEASNREEAAHNESWQILNEVKEEESSSAGRIGALETLSKGCRVNVAQKESEKWLANEIRELRIAANEWPVIKGFVPDCTSLRGLDVRKAHLAEIKLPGADLTSAQLQGTGLWEADLRGAQLNVAALKGARMTKVDLTGATLEGANLQETELEGTQLDNANLEKAKLQKAVLWGTKLSETKLMDANLSESIMFNVDLSSAQLLPKQLAGDAPPLLCQTTLPAGIEIDSDRDCNAIKETLTARYLQPESKDHSRWEKVVAELDKYLKNREVSDAGQSNMSS